MSKQVDNSEGKFCQGETKKKGVILEDFARLEKSDSPASLNKATNTMDFLSSALIALVARYEHLIDKKTQGTLSYNFFRDPLGSDTQRLLIDAKRLSGKVASAEQSGDLVTLLGQMVTSLSHFMAGNRETWMYGAIWSLLSTVIGDKPAQSTVTASPGFGGWSPISWQQQWFAFRAMVFDRYVIPDINGGLQTARSANPLDPDSPQQKPNPFDAVHVVQNICEPLFAEDGLLHVLVEQALYKQGDKYVNSVKGRSGWVWFEFGMSCHSEGQYRSLIPNRYRGDAAFFMVDAEKLKQENYTKLANQIAKAILSPVPKSIREFTDRGTDLQSYIASLQGRFSKRHVLKHYYASRLHQLTSTVANFPADLLRQLNRLKGEAKEHLRVFDGALLGHFTNAIEKSSDTESSLQMVESSGLKNGS